MRTNRLWLAHVIARLAQTAEPKADEQHLLDVLGTKDVKTVIERKGGRVFVLFEADDYEQAREAFGTMYGKLKAKGFDMDVTSNRSLSLSASDFDAFLGSSDASKA